MQLIKSQRGVSLIELSIAIGVFSIAALSAVEITRSAIQAEVFSRNASDSLDLDREVKMALNEKTTYAEGTSAKDTKSKDWDDCINQNLFLKDNKFENGTPVDYIKMPSQKRLKVGEQYSKNINIKNMTLQNVIHVTAAERHKGEVVIDYETNSANGKIERTLRYPIYFASKLRHNNEEFSCITPLNQDTDLACEQLGLEYRDNRADEWYYTGEVIDYPYEVAYVIRCDPPNEVYYYDAFSWCFMPGTFKEPPASEYEYGSYTEHYYWPKQDVRKLTNMNESCQPKAADSCAYMGGKLDANNNCDMCAGMNGTWVDGTCSVIYGAETAPSPAPGPGPGPGPSGPPPSVENVWKIKSEIYDQSSGASVPKCKMVVGAPCDNVGDELMCFKTQTANNWLAVLKCEKR
jgi:prepilin-type N-terminal cleavage/methylation domain-containing protein